MIDFLRSLKPAHWIAFSAFLVGLAALLNSQPTFSGMLTPSFLSGVLVQTAAFIVALFADKKTDQ